MGLFLAAPMANSCVQASCAWIVLGYAGEQCCSCLCNRSPHTSACQTAWGFNQALACTTNLFTLPVLCAHLLQGIASWSLPSLLGGLESAIAAAAVSATQVKDFLTALVSLLQPLERRNIDEFEEYDEDEEEESDIQLVIQAAIYFGLERVLDAALGLQPDMWCSMQARRSCSTGCMWLQTATC